LGINKYINFRKNIIDFVTREMQGPGSESFCDAENEIISEDPLQRYSVGILYPQNMYFQSHDNIDDTGQNTLAQSERDEVLDSSANITNQYYPSAIGLSFLTSKLNPSLKVRISATKYTKVKVRDCYANVDSISEIIFNSSVFSQKLNLESNKLRLLEKLTREDKDLLLALCDNETLKKQIYYLYNIQNNGWIRKPLTNGQREYDIPSAKDKTVSIWEKDIIDGLKIYCIRRPSKDKSMTLFTISLINTYKAKENKKNINEMFFQTGLEVDIIDSESEFLEYFRNDFTTMDSDEISLSLLYRNKKNYGIGHGCSINWISTTNKIEKLYSEIIPIFEIPQLNFEVKEIEGKASESLLMKNLSNWSNLSHAQIIESLCKFTSTYECWIKSLEIKIRAVPSKLYEQAIKQIIECKSSLQRMNIGINILDRDKTAFEAFQLANRAMIMQREHTIIQRKKKIPNVDQIIWPDYQESDAKWRPFQLAFFLLNLDGLTNEDSCDRNIVDLIWFPTGGGKTEAYLGISAFIIFLRRLKYPNNYSGTSVLMRYTLRLLTSQQFQRASTLICACELIRKENIQRFGDKPITIGLWIGRASTPNNLTIAYELLDKLCTGVSDKNPFQVLKCPWCGTTMVRENNIGSWGYKPGSRPKRFILFCPEKTCAFNSNLPIQVVDEDIYNNPPTLLFGTVDKFAMMPWKKEISDIFAITSNNRSPELIIQDELHLISGPLGSIVGIYETALDALCSQKKIKPKIIASTATIRHADEQIRSLYDRPVKQFPAQGLDAEDSFYAREADLNDKPGRLYIGVMAAGKTLTTTQVRLISSLLQGVYEIKSDAHIKDKYWTLVTYFNTIRELGKCSTLLDDDIKDYIRRMSFRRGKDKRIYYDAQELTSRERAENIPKILDRLEISYPDNKSINILLASNMMSVGVDIERLNLMTVISQPKTTSEYIQATSRIGRNYPGLVFVLYDGARPRDRSHYEQFTSYHQAFYKFVEPTSVTPFSGPSRERGLHAVVVTMVRHLLNLRNDNQAADFNLGLTNLNIIKQIILDRVEDIMPEEKDATLLDINKLLQDWDKIAKLTGDKNLTYGNPRKQHLLYPAGKKKDKYWATLQSMRNVDVECNILIKD